MISRDYSFNQANSDFEVAGGGVMYKLLMRAFPGWYRGNSVYALYPFTTPEGNKEIFVTHGNLQEFDFGQPAFIRPPHPITTWEGVVHAQKDQEPFRVLCKTLFHCLYTCDKLTQ